MSKEGNRNSITGKKLRNQSTALLINRSGTVRPDQRGLQSPHLSIFQHQHALPLSHTRITCSPLITHPHQRALPFPHTCISVLSPYHTPTSHALPLPHTRISVLSPYHTPASACSPLITLQFISLPSLPREGESDSNTVCGLQKLEIGRGDWIMVRNWRSFYCFSHSTKCELVLFFIGLQLSAFWKSTTQVLSLC